MYQPELPCEVGFGRKSFPETNVVGHFEVFWTFPEGEFEHFLTEFDECASSLAWNRDGKRLEEVNQALCGSRSICSKANQLGLDVFPGTFGLEK